MTLLQIVWYSISSIKLSVTSSRYIVPPSELMPKNEKLAEFGSNIGLGVGAMISKSVTVAS